MARSAYPPKSKTVYLWPPETPAVALAAGLPRDGKGVPSSERDDEDQTGFNRDWIGCASRPSNLGFGYTICGTPSHRLPSRTAPRSTSSDGRSGIPKRAPPSDTPTRQAPRDSGTTGSGPCRGGNYAQDCCSINLPSLTVKARMNEMSRSLKSPDVQRSA